MDKRRALGRYWKAGCPYPRAAMVMNLAGDWLSMGLRTGPAGIREWEREEQRLERSEGKTAVEEGEREGEWGKKRGTSCRQMVEMKRSDSC